MLIYVCKLRFKVRFCLALPSLATFSEAPAGIVVGGESESKGESESGSGSGGKVKGKGGSKGKSEGVWVAFGLRRGLFESFEAGPEGG
ncbi:MAG: hypothetical protein CMK72_13380 [Pseudomonadaceae bacterium]|nr:hypothetical protein [Pseudomonadaceae bacterium]|tara:strand:- start:863 stop:1126 length:264 start_codon:yes stop_codon:yes gene_type:complete